MDLLSTKKRFRRWLSIYQALYTMLNDRWWKYVNLMSTKRDCIHYFPKHCFMVVRKIVKKNKRFCDSFSGKQITSVIFFSIYHTRYNLFHILPLSFFSSAIFESNICNELHRIAKKYFFEATTATAINVERVKLKSARSKISAVDSFLIGLLCHLMMKRASVCNRFFIVLYTYINSPFLFGHSHENGN